MVARVTGRLGQLLDRDVRARDVGIAEPHVDHVATGAAGLIAQLVDDGEHVGRQSIDPAKLHVREVTGPHWAGRFALRRAPGAIHRAGVPAGARPTGGGEQPGPDGAGLRPEDSRSMSTWARAKGASTKSANARRVGSMSTSPAEIRPPPSTISSGSRAFARLARPRATHHPNRSMISRAGVPFGGGGRDVLAADRFGVTAGQVDQPRGLSRDGHLPAEGARGRCPDANRSQHPCLPHGQRGPCGSTTMWPNSPAYRLEPSISRPPEMMAPADPGAEGDHQDLVGAAGPPPACSRPTRGGGVVADPHLPARRAAPSASMTGVPTRPWQVGGEAHRPVPSTRPGTPTPIAPRPPGPASRRAAAATSSTTADPLAARLSRCLEPPRRQDPVGLRAVWCRRHRRPPPRPAPARTREWALTGLGTLPPR